MKNAIGEIEQAHSSKLFDEIINDDLENAKKEIVEWINKKYNWLVIRCYSLSFRTIHRKEILFNSRLIVGKFITIVVRQCVSQLFRAVGLCRFNLNRWNPTVKMLISVCLLIKWLFGLLLQIENRCNLYTISHFLKICYPGSFPIRVILQLICFLNIFLIRQLATLLTQSHRGLSPMSWRCWWVLSFLDLK